MKITIHEAKNLENLSPDRIGEIMFAVLTEPESIARDEESQKVLRVMSKRMSMLQLQTVSMSEARSLKTKAGKVIAVTRRMKNRPNTIEALVDIR